PNCRLKRAFRDSQNVTWAHGVVSLHLPFTQNVINPDRYGDHFTLYFPIQHSAVQRRKFVGTASTQEHIQYRHTTAMRYRDGLAHCTGHSHPIGKLMASHGGDNHTDLGLPDILRQVGSDGIGQFYRGTTTGLNIAHQRHRDFSIRPHRNGNAEILIAPYRYLYNISCTQYVLVDTVSGFNGQGP